jgi:hypothetical protein
MNTDGLRSGTRIRVYLCVSAALLALALAGTTSVFVTLVRLERIAQAERPEARHWLEREPEAWSWSQFIPRLATHLYVHTQRSLIVAPASAFAIGAAWLLVSATRRSRSA